MNRDFKKYLFFIAFTALSLSAWAQTPPGDPPAVPIDGGISLLAAAGIGYGTKKIMDHRKKQKQKEEE